MAWNGLTLPADHPFWQTHYPPNGWGCRCRVVGANGPEGAKLLGGDPDYNEPPPGWDEIDPKTKEPVGIDKGWGYMPGATSDLVRTIQEKIAKLPPPLADELAREVRRLAPWDVNTPVGQWHEASMQDAPQWLRDAFARAGAVTVVEKRGAHSNYHRMTNTIVIGAGKETPQGTAMWRHEFGHAMDFKLGREKGFRFYVSASEDFTKAMERDGDALLKYAGLSKKSKAQEAIRLANLGAQHEVSHKVASLTGKEERERFIEELARGAGVDLQAFRQWFVKHSVPGELPEGSISRHVYEARFFVAWQRRDAQGLLDVLEQLTRGEDGSIETWEKNTAYNKGTPAMLSDLFSACTNNGIQGCAWHRQSYYKERQGWGRQAESWANITSVAGTGDFGVKLLERFVPEMLQCFRRLL